MGNCSSYLVHPSVPSHHSLIMLGWGVGRWRVGVVRVLSACSEIAFSYGKVGR